MPTLVAVLENESKGQVSPAMNRRKGEDTDRSLPASMISFSPSEDMGGSERKRDLGDETIPGL
jgi:hypothetical protein